ncbi:MAG TPA: site-2 protease family protein [Bryobacteraceae bacterium]|nr:site-2 protease family protein [Bryobacteraceae bacterium]
MHLDFTTALLNVALLWLLTTPHEFAHAWVATRLGDDTPRLQGRLTLNPLAHVDWLGTTILPLLTSLFSGGFIGWGKPVYTNPAKLRGGLNGLALVAMAGPASNVVFAVILAAVARATVTFSPALAQFAAHGVNLSLYLAIFNMLPVPPLDGSKLLLAARVPVAVYNELARAGFLLLVVVVSVSNLGRWMAQWSYAGTEQIFGLFR